MSRNQPRPLKHPPIREAVVEIRVVDESVGDRLQLLKDLAENLKADYPTVNRVEHFEGVMQFEPSMEKATGETRKREQVGFRLTSKDSGHVVQLLRDRMIFSLIVRAPNAYLGWDSLRTPALDLWLRFRKALGSPMVKRIGLRYIDHMQTPPIHDAISALSPSDGLPMVNTYHKVSGAEWGSLASTLARSEIHSEKQDLRLIVQQAWALKPGTKDHELVLDIDAIRIRDMKGERDEMETELEELRAVKNRVFFDTFSKEVLASLDS